MREGKTPLECIEWGILKLEAYERKVYGVSYSVAAAIHDLIIALKSVAPGNEQTKRALAAAEEARIQLAAFAPYGESFDLKHLRQRQQAVHHLRKVAVAAGALAPNDEAEPAHPGCIQLVRADDEEDQLEADDVEGGAQL